MLLLQADGAKFMCSASNAQPGCVIYSLGSNGDVSFENDIIKSTPCQVSACRLSQDARARSGQGWQQQSACMLAAGTSYVNVAPMPACRRGAI
jgi:hypothetical protein